MYDCFELVISLCDYDLNAIIIQTYRAVCFLW